MGSSDLYPLERSFIDEIACVALSWDKDGPLLSSAAA